MTRLLVVGAGPAGRALAHRALAHGLEVTLVDPDPHRAWTATYGMFTDDLPDWLPRTVIACGAPEFVVYTPVRRVLARGYAVLDGPALQRALDVSGADLETGFVAGLTADSVLLSDGRRLTADAVVDARGNTAADPAVPRQRAHGSFHPAPAGPPEMVLMDWSRAPAGDPSFSYRVDLGDGRRLVEETCLAGNPATGLPELARRNTERAPDPGRWAPEEVDFPLYRRAAPWRERGATAAGAAGGLMHPATGYSLAESLRSADVLAAGLAAGRDPRAVLWTPAARWTHRLRMLGLAVLLGFDGPALTVFFDVFFALPISRQRAYLTGRDDLRGTAAAMWAVFRGLGWRLRLRLLRTTAAAAMTLPLRERRAPGR